MRNILHKYEKTGILEHTASHGGTYLDYPDQADFHAAMNTIAKAEEMFLTVPAEIRKKFGNDPAEFCDFMQNPENRDKIEKMGFDASYFGPKPEQEIPPVGGAAEEPAATLEGGNQEGA